MSDHKANAINNLRSLHDWQSDEGITDATLTTVAIEAVAQATLYLAEQQRLANLIEIAKWNSDALKFGRARRAGDAPIDMDAENAKLDSLMETIRQGVDL